MDKQTEKRWAALYDAAMQVLKPRQVSPMIEAGSVAAAVESTGGNIYTGICVDTACTLGICAERNAIFHMLTCGENGIRRVIAVDSEGKTVPPCGACRELMAQLMPDTCRDIEIMLNYENGRVAALRELIPEWWI